MLKKPCCKQEISTHSLNSVMVPFQGYMGKQSLCLLETPAVHYYFRFLFSAVNCSVFFVPTFDTKVTEYLCSGWVFFFRQISTF